MTPNAVDAFAQAVERVGEIAPLACRLHVERKFSSRSLVEGYVRIYDPMLLRGAKNLVVGRQGRQHLVADEVVP